ncbi:hypothetical protein Adt_12613 [Abeliophyllum distichum]|uniref:Uncharacterized protein n=1 Tax=Abeliophyllum distichum TaxID=126358 RepID=A0ABD1UR63_9LAMI
MHQPNLASNWCKMHQLDAGENCTSRRKNCTSHLVQNAPARLVQSWLKTSATCTSYLVQNAPTSGAIWCIINWCKMHHLCGANFTSNWCKMHQLDADANCNSQRQNCTSKLVQNALVQISPATGAMPPIFAPVSPHPMPPDSHQFCNLNTDPILDHEPRI